MNDLDGIAVVADDILVYGEGNADETEKDHDEKLKKLLERCKETKFKTKQIKGQI